jgi:hypothetical protein
MITYSRLAFVAITSAIASGLWFDLGRHGLTIAFAAIALVTVLGMGFKWLRELQ